MMQSTQVFSPTQLARLRKAKGWTQEGLARRANLATVTVSKLEEGKVQDPNSSTLHKLANALGCPVTQLMGADT